MATISLYASKINNMPGLINDVKKSVKSYKSELSDLRKKSLKVNRSICNLDDAISAISTSTKTQEEKIQSLETFHDNSEQFITDTVKIDGDVAEIVNQNKDDFYDKYYYLKPECEKNGWEKFCDGCKKVGEWCKDNWKAIVGVVVAVLAVVAIVVATVATFGAAAVLVAGAIGALVGLLGELIGDVVVFAATGKWEGTWEGYLGAALGGFVYGAISLGSGVLVPFAAVIADSTISTLFSESLENLTGTKKRDMSEILFDTLLSGVTAAIFKGISNSFKEIGAGKALDKFKNNIFKKAFGLNRLSGRGSFEASYKAVLTKLKTRTIKKITWKTIRNGIFKEIPDIISDSIFDFKGGFKDLVKKYTFELIEINRPSNSYEIQMPEINVLPVGSY